MKEVGIPDVIHTYGLWTYHNYLAQKFSKKYKVAHVIAPCGMLIKEALLKSSYRKKLLGFFIKRMRLIMPR